MRSKQSPHGIFGSREGEIPNVEFGHLKYSFKGQETGRDGLPSGRGDF